ncbi:ParB/RepB/Spo0J family partition protein, partial [Bacteriovoracaceae bacterium]|nr:ParB/RepB/Spo0J family partition protein [Bacteriovoracaceae bacterium]
MALSKNKKPAKKLGKGISALLGSKVLDDLKGQGGSIGAKEKSGSIGPKKESGSIGAKEKSGSIGPKKESGSIGANDKSGSIGPKKESGSMGAEKELSSEIPFMIDINKIKVNENQPRKIFDEIKIKELSDSIIEIGIINPLIVQEKDGKFELISGERRLRASKLAKLDRVPILVKRATKQDTVVMAIVENVQRDDLNCVEEALAYYQLMNEFQLTQEEVGKKIGKDRSTIANLLRLLKLPREVISLIQRDQLSFGHAKVLGSLKEDEKIKRFANMAVKEGFSVRELEKQIKSNKFNKPIEERNYQEKLIDEKLDSLRGNLEKKTGFHVGIKSK